MYYFSLLTISSSIMIAELPGRAIKQQYNNNDDNDNGHNDN